MLLRVGRLISCKVGERVSQEDGGVTGVAVECVEKESVAGRNSCMSWGS